MNLRAPRNAWLAIAALSWAVALLALLWTWPPIGAKFALLMAACAQLACWRSQAGIHAHQGLEAGAFEHSREGMIIADAKGAIVKVNPAFSTITGYVEAEVLGHNPRMLSSGLQDADFYEAMWDCIAREGSWQGELWNRRRDGSLYAESLSITRVNDSSGRPQHYVCVFSDITERKRAEGEIQRLAHYDPLTGLPNRALLLDRAGQALSLARRTQTPLAVMFLDLDHFKEVNDTLGHRVGDQLLIAVAKRLQGVVREHDTVSRQGGDEFVAILPGTAAEGAAHVAGKICALLAEPFEIEGQALRVTTSIGIAIFPGDGEDFDALARAADSAMYRAKHAGRDRYCLFASG